MKIKNNSARIYTIDGKQLLPGKTMQVSDSHAANPGLPFGTEIEIVEKPKQKPSADKKTGSAAQPPAADQEVNGHQPPADDKDQEGQDGQDASDGETNTGA